MTEPNSQTQPAADPNAQVVNPQAIYIKDCSFEAPNGPFISNGQGNPSVNLNLTTRATALAPEIGYDAARLFGRLSGQIIDGVTARPAPRSRASRRAGWC